MTKELALILKNEMLPIFIWGCGEVGTLTQKALDREGISYQGFVVDKMETTGGGTIPKNSYSKEQLLNEYKEYILMRGFVQAFFMSDEEIINAWPGCRNVYMIADLWEPEYTETITDEYYLCNKAAFEQVRDALADELSKKTFDAYIEVKTRKCFGPLAPHVVRPQYFFEDAPWNYKETDILLDGGAYIGDSILDFIHLRKNQYAQILACEPDVNNSEKLLKTIEDYKIANVRVINAGLYNEKTTLRFNDAADIAAGTAISQTGTVEVNVDTIDNLAGGIPVSIIKMDIEKSEMPALRGAKHTIAANRPILMISAYHKMDDLFNIYNYINEIVTDYSFYLRCHCPFAVDVVMYAVPKERLKE